MCPMATPEDAGAISTGDAPARVAAKASRIRAAATSPDKYQNRYDSDGKMCDVI